MWENHAYLSVIEWPPGVSRDGCAAILADADPSFDLATLRMRIGRSLPAAVAFAPRDAVERAAAALRAAGGDAFAPTVGAIQTLGPTRKVRDLRIVSGNLAITLWRGGEQVIRPTDIDILIRAQLSDTVTIPASGSLAPNVMPAMMIGGIGMAAVFHAYNVASLSKPETHLRTSNKLDVHTRDGQVFQVDGDKFGFAILGDLKGHSDKANVDAMCDLFAHLVPEVVIDPYFPIWRPPPGHHRVRLPDARLNGDDPAFAFYSRWMALVYRRLLKHP